MRALGLPNYDDDDVDDDNDNNNFFQFFFSNKKIKKKMGTFSKKLLKIGELRSEFKTWPLKALNLFLFHLLFLLKLKEALWG